jgi:predicted DCC family thiol-disulfide oxidoreductase YuxK
MTGDSDQATHADLPAPDEHSSTDVVIYDGQCAFCTSQARLLRRLDGKRRLAFLSLYDERVSRWYPDLSHEDLLEYVYVVTSRGQAHRGAEAVRYLSRRLPALWWLAPVLHIPGSRPVWRWLYRFVSRRRFWLSRWME